MIVSQSLYVLLLVTRYDNVLSELRPRALRTSLFCAHSGQKGNDVVREKRMLIHQVALVPRFISMINPETPPQPIIPHGWLSWLLQLRRTKCSTNPNSPQPRVPFRGLGTSHILIRISDIQHKNPRQFGLLESGCIFPSPPRPRVSVCPFALPSRPASILTIRPTRVVRRQQTFQRESDLRSPASIALLVRLIIHFA